MPKKTAKAAAINTKGAVALVKAIMSPIGSDTDSDIKPIVPTDKSKWQELNCIVPALVKQLVLYEAKHHGLSVNQVVQNALYAKYDMPETPGTEGVDVQPRS
jgi:hypothetical protein